VAPLPSTIQCAAGFRAGGLRITDVLALPHLFPSALKAGCQWQPVNRARCG
jgi:hypothetical protein